MNKRHESFFSPFSFRNTINNEQDSFKIDGDTFQHPAASLNESIEAIQKSVKYDRILKGKQKILQIFLSKGINRLNAFNQPLEKIKPHFLKMAGTFLTEQHQFTQCGSLYKGEMRRRIKGILKKGIPNINQSESGIGA